MSYIKDLGESHDSMKSIALNLIIIPFWYVAIFLFNKDFYLNSDTIIITLFSIIISFLSSMLFTFFLNKMDEKNSTPADMFGNMIASIAILSIWLSFLIFTTYSFRFLFNQEIYFYWFVVIYFTPVILIYILEFLFPDEKTDLKK